MRLGPLGEAMRAQLARAAPEIQGFYRARGYRPIWIKGWALRPDARAVPQLVDAAVADGLDPESYGASSLSEAIARARSRQPADLARAEIALSVAAAGFLSDLHRPALGAEMVYADPAVAPPRTDAPAVLARLGQAKTPGAAVADLARMNATYDDLRTALGRARTGEERRLIRANLERARALPADLGRRYVLVDAAAQQLLLYDGGRLIDQMPVVVGKRTEPTPVMSGLIRYAVVRPYWNVPPDLTAQRYAPQVIKGGRAYLDSQNMEVLSDWTSQAQVLAPEAVDWAALAAGQPGPRLRQRPGPHNMMGQVKFVFPNSLGVYLHDSPLRQYFGQSRRTESAGCVRLSDAPRLARWLLGARAGELSQPGEPETRIELAEPIPVYIVYFTAVPSEGRIARRPDIYGRDAALEAHLAVRTTQAEPKARLAV